LYTGIHLATHQRLRLRQCIMSSLRGGSAGCLRPFDGDKLDRDHAGTLLVQHLKIRVLAVGAGSIELALCQQASLLASTRLSRFLSISSCCNIAIVGVKRVAVVRTAGGCQQEVAAPDIEQV
jgi:hypothetical protein